MDIRTTETQYYVSRVHTENGRIECLQDDGRELYRPTPNKSGATRYSDRQKAGRIVNYLNGDAEAKGGNYEYFMVQSVDDERLFIDNLSEEAKAHFDTGEEDGDNSDDENDGDTDNEETEEVESTEE